MSIASKTFLGAHPWASVALVVLWWGAASVAWAQADPGPEGKNTDPSFEIRDGVYFLAGQETPFTGTSTRDDEDGNKLLEIPITDGRQHGITRAWFPGGQEKEKSHWKNGQQEGLLITYWINGQKKEESHWKDGKQNGPSTHWYHTGQLSGQAITNNGAFEGTATTWHPNGTKKSESNWKNGKRDGTVTRWYENGTMQLQAHYTNGEKNGSSTAWSEDGKKTEESHWTNGTQDPPKGMLEKTFGGWFGDKPE